MEPAEQHTWYYVCRHPAVVAPSNVITSKEQKKWKYAGVYTPGLSWNTQRTARYPHQKDDDQFTVTTKPPPPSFLPSFLPSHITQAPNQRLAARLLFQPRKYRTQLHQKLIIIFLYNVFIRTKHKNTWIIFWFAFASTFEEFTIGSSATSCEKKNGWNFC